MAPKTDDLMSEPCEAIERTDLGQFASFSMQPRLAHNEE